ncbi:MAG: MFS transporter [Deltaproteobacteria bacterium HGW-Deltaproteobacteria-23]|nr:MAG: MFS transporter [Deltaproteobacteria bacterium HGW-Deltaproteobacteria-23]
MNKNIILLFATRIFRLFAYGFLSVVLALYLSKSGFDDFLMGVLFSLTLVGDAGISLLLTTTADRFGRKKTLIIGAVLMMLAGLVFVLTSNPVLLIFAAIVGVISPSGNEIGPFLPVEQAMLSQLVSKEQRPAIFAWYNLSGSVATAFGALIGGWLATLLQNNGLSPLDSYRYILIGYALIGGLLALVFTGLSQSCEVAPSNAAVETKNSFGLHESRGVVTKLSMLFALDAFAGGFVLQSFMAYWFHIRFGANEATLGSIFFGANLLAGVSALLAVPLAKKIGLIRTMVFTHLPSNILLILVPLMPNFTLAITMLLLRFSISQMDVPTRQAYTMAVVKPDERSAAAGITGIARSIGASLSPAVAGAILPLFIGGPFIIAGGLKIVYDLLLFRGFKASKVED